MGLESNSSQPKPLVSVIIPTYNRAHLVSRALDSVIAQTYGNVQIVVVNNGCEDNTAEVLERYSRHPQVEIVSLEKNGRVYKAYNVGLDRVRGKYTTFLYDDDTFFPDALDVLVCKAEELGPGFGLVFGNCVDPAAKKVTGSGLRGEGPVTFEDVMSGRLRGEFSGIWRTDALGSRRFEIDLEGESMVWYDMYRNTKGFYVCHPIRQYNMYRSDSISLPSFDFPTVQRKARSHARYMELFGDDMRRICPAEYSKHLGLTALWKVMAGERWSACSDLLKAVTVTPSARTVAQLGVGLMPSSTLQGMLALRAQWLKGKANLARWRAGMSELSK